MGFDTIEIEILEDGTIKFSTGKISNVNHSAADGFFNTLQQLCGTVPQRIRKGLSHIHAHLTGEHHHDH